MPRKSTYDTRQLETLRRHLASHAGRHLTVREIGDALAADGAPVGRATLYRLLGRLVGEGCVIRHVPAARAAACYEFTGPDPCGADEEPFHCYCESCGRLLHLHCPSWDRLKTHLSRAHRFRLDPVRTVFYGFCADCAPKRRRKETPP